MRNQVALVVQQYQFMKNFMDKKQLPAFKYTNGLCFGNRYVINYDSDAEGYFDEDKAWIGGYDHNTGYGKVKDLIIELYTSHGIDSDFDHSIPVSVLEEAV